MAKKPMTAPGPTSSGFSSGSMDRPHYDRDFVETEFTPAKIAEQGRYLLFRALNIGRAIGFVGSGVPAAYGRPLWSTLIGEIAERVHKESTDGPVLEASRNLANAGLPGVSDPDLLPLRAHMLKTLSSEKQINDEVKKRTINDDYIARRAWQPLIFRGMATDGPVRLGAVKWNDLDDPTIWRALDSRPVLDRLIALLEADAPGMPSLAAIRGRLSELSGNTTEARLGAEERTLVPLLTLVAKTLPTEAQARIADLLWEAAGCPKDNIPEQQLSDFRSRWKSADAHRSNDLNPISTLLDKLRISRLITTNYDFELELGLERLGFGGLRPDGADSETLASSHRSTFRASRPRGDLARAAVFEKETAADLIDFAVHGSNFDYQVFHLHGRAGPGDGLVITERDYQAAYMRDSPDGRAMREALQVAFGGNPILFVGMGMLEADVLRPLRRFVSEPTGRANRSIIALLPTEEARERRVATALQLYLRYGVHVIFFGDTDEAPTDFKGAPWQADARVESDSAPLYRTIVAIRALMDALSHRPRNEMGRLLDWLREGRTTGPASAARLAALLLPIRQFLGAQNEEPLLGHSVDLLEGLLLDPRILETLQSEADPDWRAADGKDSVKAFLIEYLRQLDGRLRTRALCRALDSLGDKRSGWWEQWRRLPQARYFAHLVEERTGWDTLSGPIWRQISAKAHHKPWLPAAKPPRSPSPNPIRVMRFGVEDHWRAGKDDPIEGLLTKILKTPARSRGRLSIVRGEAGSGRGSLFHALSERFASPHNGRKDPNYGWGLFINAAFSIEYSSVIDGVTDFLWRCTCPSDDRWIRFGDGSRKPRAEAVSDYFEQMIQRSPGPGLIVVSSVEFLFDQRGKPKNLDIVAALRQMLVSAQEHGVDVILICRDDRCRAVFGIADSEEASSMSGKLVPVVFGSNDRTGGRGGGPQLQAGLFDLKVPDLRLRTRWALEDRQKLGPPDWKVGADLMLRILDDREQPVRLPLDPMAQVIKGRFQASIVAACGLETYWAIRNQSTSGDDSQARQQVRSFLSGLADASARTTDTARFSDLVFSAVLRQYVRLGAVRTGDRQGRYDPEQGELIDPALCELVLKHLAVMSAPVEAGVLLRCPEIDAWLEQKSGAEAWKGLSEENRLELLKPTLTRLGHRRLLFRMRGRGDINDPQLGAGIDFHTRFAVHQSLQSYFFKQIGSPHLVFGDSRLFTVSLFASQSSELPTPTKQGYDFMISLIENLAQHPRAPKQPETVGEARRQCDVAALRAAVSLTRSAFSLAVISRLGELERSDSGPDSFGYLERYRLLLRWMIYQAGRLGDLATPESEQERGSYERRLKKIEAKRRRDSRNAATKLTADRMLKGERINALYQDEITWLYNECGLASFAQGNLFDAIALFGQAHRSNNYVEIKGRHTPNALRIRLNLAMVQIERGNLRRADRELRDIAGNARSEPVVRAIARGYLGLVAHLRGRFTQADGYYRKTLDMLRDRGGEERALSIFNRHYADMLRNRKERERAQEHLRTALAEAETAGQQDQVQRVRISQALFDLAAKPVEHETLRRVMRQLRAVERYADDMEIHSLKVDVHTTRARVFEMQGETQMSGESAIAGLSIATLHGMKLRVMAALAMIGRITWERGFLQQAMQISTTARHMAELAGYQLSVARADAVLVDASDPSQTS